MVSPMAGSGAMVRVESAAERDYRRRLVQIERRKRRVAGLQADVAALRLGLGRFAADYHARVGSLFAELDRIQLTIDEYGERIDRLRANRFLDVAGLEADIEERFAERRRRVEGEEAEAQGYEERRRAEADRPRLRAEDAAEAKRLYRDLARRYHPDLARTPEERERREAMMLRVNEAFRDRSLDALRALHRAGEVDDPGFDARSLADRLAWAAEEIARLGAMVADLHAELGVMRASDTHRLWVRSRDDPGSLETMVADVRHAVRKARGRMRETLATYRSLLDVRNAA
ncbi:MAG: J domain-containing protein [Chloroflexota bacterium]|nr:J domain-containing protein [Chloroflexota bacterium]